jgi:hypothetical protein
MPLLVCFTFNSRCLVMLLTMFLYLEWVYFAVEIWFSTLGNYRHQASRNPCARL